MFNDFGIDEHSALYLIKFLNCKYSAFSALLARVFISDMTKARLEGLLDAFPKLIASEKCNLFFSQKEL